MKAWSLKSRPRTAGMAALGLVLVAFIAVWAVRSGQPTTPEEIDGLLVGGLQAHFSGDIEKARENYEKILEADPTNKFALYNLGLIEQQADRLETAESFYRRALATDPHFAPALFNLAIIRSASAPQEAADLYQRVIAQNPNDAAAHLNLGFVLVSLGRVEEAQSEFVRAVELDPRLADRVPAPPQADSSPSPSPKS